jgi:FkbM family methyltransferase
MQLGRARYVLSPRRLRVCRSLFRSPWQSLVRLAFLGREPITLTLRTGQKLAFSRTGRDHLFWDWYLHRGESLLEFTADGEVQLEYQGRQLLLRPGTIDFFIFREIFLEDQYGLNELPATLDTVLDLGGNVGLFSCAILPRARRVITVEAVAACYRQAAKNIARNGGDLSSLLRYAVTGRSGDRAAIHLSAGNAGMNSLVAGWVKNSDVLGVEWVPTLSLPDLLALTRCDEVDLLKCDIEGAEFDVFLATPLPTLRKILRIVMEVHVNREHPRSSLDALVTHLCQAGFDLTCRNLDRRAEKETWFLKAQRRR